jgi:ATP-binding cassette subfamily B multidrug efflux pump
LGKTAKQYGIMSGDIGKKEKKIFDFSLLLRIFSYAKPYAGKFRISVVLTLTLAILTPLRPLIINKTLARVNEAGQSDYQPVLDFLIMVTIFQLIILVVEAVLRFYFSYLTSWMGHSVVKDMRVAVYQKILNLNLRQFDQTPIGTLTTRTINDIESINDIFAEGLVPILADFLSIVAILGAMFYTDWQLTLVCLIPFPLMIIATYFFKESVNKSFTQVRNAVASLNAFVQEHISGMQIIQAFTAESREKQRFEAINRKHRDANIRAIFAYSIFFPVVEVVLAFAMGILVWYASRNASSLNTDSAIYVAGHIVSFMLLLNLLFRPLRVIADKFNVLQMGMVAGERVLKVIDNTDMVIDSPKAIDMPVQGKINFQQVNFSYNNDSQVLHNISFEVKPGETLAIVGSTGSGKSTIISLISRLYQHQSGSILVDDRPVEAYTLASLRKGIAVVLQDVFLFSGSILDNITLRNPAISRAEVENTAKMIGIHDFIMQLPGDYDYQVMERGTTLSLGQRQLLSFIRAMLFKPAILILDEATSSVDTHTEQLIQHAISVLTRGRTSIVIAHRLSTVQMATRILVLEKGRVVEEGTHSQLMETGGYYARLKELQLG